MMLPAGTQIQQTTHPVELVLSGAPVASGTRMFHWRRPILGRTKADTTCYNPK